MSDQRYGSAVQRCACVNIRRADRIITQFYDEIMAPSGLSAAQFGLLATIAEIAPITINGLAERMVLDRTTLTRNLEVLIKQDLVQNREGEDRRTRLVLPTRTGEKALEQAWPLWQEAQSRVELAFGRERFDALLNGLSLVSTLAS